MMTEDEYRAYLLRLWRVEDNGKRWRARLEDIGSGESLGFGSLGQLIDFLHSLEGRADQPGKGTGEQSNAVEDNIAAPMAGDSV